MEEGATGIKFSRLVKLTVVTLILLFLLSAEIVGLVVMVDGAISHFKKKPEIQALEHTLPLVEVRRISPGPHNKTLSFIGNLEAYERYDLGFSIGGRIERVEAREGEAVEAGQILAVLDTDLYDAQLERAKASLGKARRDFERVERLWSKKMISAKSKEEAETALALADAEIALVMANIKNAVLKTPIAGVLSRRLADPEELATPGAPVFTVLDISKVILKLNVPDVRYASLKVGQEASMKLRALPERDFEGRVHRLDVAADDRTGLFGVEVLFENPRRILKPGMIGEAVIEIRRFENVYSIPFDLTVLRFGKRVAFVEDRSVARAVPLDGAVHEGNRLLVSLDPAGAPMNLIVKGMREFVGGEKLRVLGRADPDGTPNAQTMGVAAPKEAEGP